ncbi:MAG TPA: sugar phosphate isomerase/epimerase family protein [bacterium]|nr:sugar phosphate isomerase/epimerase family protein [bacterium]
MNPGQPQDLSRLCIHTITTKPWEIEEAAPKFAGAGVKGITVWRDAFEGRDPVQVGNLVRDEGLEIVSLCRGGFFPHPEAAKRKQALQENRTGIEEAAALGAPLVVLVCGAHPAQSLEESREQIIDGIQAILSDAEQAGVRLAIEPLHPMYADTRSAINTLRQANDVAEQIDSAQVGVAVDVYHLWWDPDLEAEIRRAGRQHNLFAFHICDWKSPTRDLLYDRGIMGEGCIPIRRIREWVEDTGFDGYHEVEIFSKQYWSMDQDEYLARIMEAYRKNI